ncbi:MAG: pyruvate, water dikinase [Candidatus Parcubacteria bacterium]
MAHELINKFGKILNGANCFTIRGPLSPLFLTIPWQVGELSLDLLSISKGRDCLEVLNEDNYFEIARLRFEQYWLGKVSIQQLRDEYYLFEKETYDFYNEITTKDLSKFTDEQLTDVFKKIVETSLGGLQNTIYLECIDYEKILSVIGKDKKSSLDLIWENATHPIFVSFEGRRLKFLIDAIKNNDKNIVRKVKFIFTDYIWTKPETEISSLIIEIRNNLEQRTFEYQKKHESISQIILKDNEWKTNLSKEQLKIVDYMQMVMHFRDIRKDAIAQIQAIMCEVSTEMFKRAGINGEHAPNTILFELIKGVEHIRGLKKEIESRKNGFIVLVRVDNTYELGLCNFDEAIADVDSKLHKLVHTDTIKGSIANRGKLTGHVRIVLDPHGYVGFKQGDILVTSMTRPEFVPLMKLAGAVITNEGGITCHAAIVSRELNIPCVIGTKIATRALKDGDIVEVDANKGIITVIK